MAGLGILKYDTEQAGTDCSWRIAGFGRHGLKIPPSVLCFTLGCALLRICDLAVCISHFQIDAHAAKNCQVYMTYLGIL
jgi:hypothetical protein